MFCVLSSLRTVSVGWAPWASQALMRSSLRTIVEGSGWVLYARAAEFADCRRFTPPGGTAVLCDRTPQSRRRGPGYYLYLGGPGRAAFGGPVSHDGTVRRFALAAIVHQPLDYLANLESRELRFVRADRNVFQIKKYRHGGIGLRSAHWLGHVNGQCRGKASDGAKPAVGPEGRSWPHRLNT